MDKLLGGTSGDSETITALQQQIDKQKDTIHSLQEQVTNLQNNYDLLEADFVKLKTAAIKNLQNSNVAIEDNASVDIIIENLSYMIAKKPISFSTSSATISTGQTITPFSHSISDKVSNLYIYVSVGNLDAARASSVRVTLQASTDNKTWDNLKNTSLTRPTHSKVVAYDEYVAIQKDYHYFRLTVYSDDNENSNLFKILYM